MSRGRDQAANLGRTFVPKKYPQAPVETQALGMGANQTHHHPECSRAFSSGFYPAGRNAHALNPGLENRSLVRRELLLELKILELDNHRRSHVDLQSQDTLGSSFARLIIDGFGHQGAIDVVAELIAFRDHAIVIPIV